MIFGNNRYRVVTMPHQTPSLGMYWKLFPATLKLIGGCKLSRAFHRCLFSRTLHASPYKLCCVLCLKYSNVSASKILFFVRQKSHFLMIALMFPQLDNHGNHMLLTDESPINVPGIAAAHVIKRYTAQAADEISLEV